MKIFKFLFISFMLLSFGNVSAHGHRHGHGRGHGHDHENRCQTLDGYIQIYPSSRCHILTKKERYFSDQTFLQELGVPDSCFSGWLEGYLGGRWISGGVISGFTANGNANDDGATTMFTAATGIKIFDAYSGRRLGRIFTLDSIYDPEGDTQEFLSMIEGTERFRGTTGNFQVHGNALSGAPVSGEICFGHFDDD